MGVTGGFAMYPCSTEALHINLLAENGFDNLRAGYEHLGNLVHHEYIIRKGRGINRSSGTRTEDNGNLRDNAAVESVAEENLSISGKGVYTLLDTGSTGIVDTDQRNPHPQGIIHNLGYLAGVHAAQ